MARLLGGLGNPHAALLSVHVVGTKGKGSTAALLSSILHTAGVNTGTYTSPHVVDLTERIAVGGAPLRRADLDALAAAAAPALGRALGPGGAHPTWFEAVTALALRHFADAGVEVAIMEAGLGGGTDATNVWGDGEAEGGAATRPPAAVIATPVDLEHAAALGGSLAAVAASKASILARPGVPLILAGQAHAEAEAAFTDRAAGLGCPVVRVERVASIEHAGVEVEAGEARGVTPTTALRLVLDGQAINDALGKAATSPLPPSITVDARLRLVGGHQAANAAAAAVGAAVLAATGVAPPGTASAACLAAGLAATPPLPGRFQLARLAAPVGGPGAPPLTIVLDGAHTPSSAAALAATLRAAFPPPTPLGYVLAAAGDKDLAGLADALVRTGPLVTVFTTVPIGGSTDRAAAPGALAGAWQGARARAAAAGGASPPLPRCREMVKASLPAAIDAAAREIAAAVPGWAGPRVLCVTGSLHAAGEALRASGLLVVE